MRSQTARVALCSLLALALFGACTPSATTQPTAEPTLALIPTITSPEQVSLPIYSYLPTVDLSVAIMLQDQALINQCAADKGSSERSGWSLVGSTGTTSPATSTDLRTQAAAVLSDDVRYSGMWQFFNPATVDQYGYGRPPAADTVLSTYVGVDGSALKWCNDAVNQITPSGNAMSPISVSSLPGGGPGWHSEDSRYVDATRAWATCMKNQGFNYDTPLAAISDFPTPAAQSSDKAKAVAVADVNCKVSTNLVGIAVAVQSAYEQQYIDANRDALAAWKTSITNYLAGKIPLPSSVSSDHPTSAPS